MDDIIGHYHVFRCIINRPIFVIGSLYLDLSMVDNHPRGKKNQGCSPKPTSHDVLL